MDILVRDAIFFFQNFLLSEEKLLRPVYFKKMEFAPERESSLKGAD